MDKEDWGKFITTLLLLCATQEEKSGAPKGGIAETTGSQRPAKGAEVLWIMRSRCWGSFMNRLKELLGGIHAETLEAWKDPKIHTKWLRSLGVDSIPQGYRQDGSLPKRPG